MTTTLVRLQVLSKTKTDLQTTNPVLMEGEFVIADVNTSIPVVKCGDGSRPWTALPDLVKAGAGANYVAGTVTTLPPGQPATVVIDNNVSPPTINFGIPTGPKGDKGDTGIQGPVGPRGPANSLAIGTVVTGIPAAANITGTPPNQILNLQLPPGPPNSLAIGTVTTLPPGSSATATITGTPPNQTLNLGIPAGSSGTAGSILSDNSHVTGDWLFDPTAYFGFSEQEVNEIRGNTAVVDWATVGATSLHAESNLFLSSTGSPYLVMQRVSGGYASTAALGNGDPIGDIVFRGSGPGNSMGVGAIISAMTTGAWAASSHPTELQFWTTPSASTSFRRALNLYTSTDATFAYLDTAQSYFRFQKPIDAGAGTIYAADKQVVDGSDSYLRLNQNGDFASGIYTPGVFRAASGVRADNWIADQDSSKYLAWNHGTFMYGSAYLVGASNGYTGLIVSDVLNMTLMSDGTNGGIFFPGEAWLLRRTSPSEASSQYNITANNFTAQSFNVSSARELKRETGAPQRARDLIARLRPIFYRLLANDSREQLGLIAEEVQEVCPQLSDGKTVSYDRLACLLVAAWQEQFATVQPEGAT